MGSRINLPDSSSSPESSQATEPAYPPPYLVRSRRQIAFQLGDSLEFAPPIDRFYSAFFSPVPLSISRPPLCASNTVALRRIPEDVPLRLDRYEFHALQLRHWLIRYHKPRPPGMERYRDD